MGARSSIEAAEDPLAKWDHWVDWVIVAAQERGDFDDLPGHGKPLQLNDNPYAGEWALGFHALKNAGIAPLWMELDREIQALRATMQSKLDRLTEQLSRHRPADLLRAQPHPGQITRRSRWDVRSWWHEFTRVSRDMSSPSHEEAAFRAIARASARRDYLALAESLDEKIRLYNHALPAGLQHLERVRMPPDEAAKVFDSACPPDPHAHTG